ncbi:peptidase S41 [Sphingobacterium sp. SGG-5]|uniref:S41 family peptidase n=1 Tax=Sphingobacterium sp. SGG-5 TaxID=2710881 RepID=UPI0013E9F791|nr:S41 family peptidase [Sphingobacterium sp. SGG-5]NGM60500.1 peptidase S41 [Sphingobacterium sp. SGG-5]
MSCKKEVVEPDGSTDERSVYLDDEFENKVRDSIWYYYKVVSLWQDMILPKTSSINLIDRRNYLRDNYTQYFETGEDVLEHLMAQTKTSSNGSNYDWYSFIDRKGVISGELQDGITSSYGMWLLFLSETSNDPAYLYVRSVDKNSSVYAAGIRRGDRIVSIDGKTNLDFTSQELENFKTIDEFLLSSKATLGIEPPSGSPFTKEIVSTSFNIDPVLDDRVIEYKGKKVGYLAFDSFVDVNGSNGMKGQFDDIFDEFEDAGINELVVDLRYNGGGATNTAEYLVNRIAPASANGDIMYTYDVNPVLKGWGWLDEGEEFGPVKIVKNGNLNLTRVYFLVTDGTASASELLMNSLKAHMTVYMIGVYGVANNQQVSLRTYGKPVGFFGINIVNEDIQLYASSFKTFNKNKEGNYFDGMIPNAHVWEFENFRDFGDPQETMLAAALEHIAPSPKAKIASAGTTKEVPAVSKSIKSFDKSPIRHGMFKYKKD